MNKIKQFLNFITPQHDKLKHFWLDFIIGVFSFLVYTKLRSLYIIILPSLIIGLTIEVYQYKTKTGKFELMDIFFTVLHSLFLAFVVWVL